MKELVPLMQSLVWPIFLGILIYFFKDWFRELLQTIKNRIEEGGEFNVGPTGFGMGAAPRLPDEPIAEDMIDDGDEEKSAPELLAQEQKIEEEEKREPSKTLQLVHRTSFLKIKGNRNYYRIIVSLDTWDPGVLAKVERVVYYLHRTFKNPVREVSDSSNNFTLMTAAWGEFTIRADVFLKGQKEPLRLSRYITIQP